MNRQTPAAEQVEAKPGLRPASTSRRGFSPRALLPAAAIPASGPSHHQTEHDEHGQHHGHAVHWIDLARIAVVGLAILAVWFQLWEPLPHVSLVSLLAMALGGYPIVKEAFSSLLARRMTMELSMTIALVAALVIGEFLTVLVIIFFVLIAEVLEGLTVGRGRRAIHDLLHLLPNSATVRRRNGIQEIAADQLLVDDIVIVKPGGRLPVDGIVVDGYSAIDQSAITGESMPVEKSVGADVYAGTINQSGSIELRVTGVGRDTAFGRIIEAVERAEKLRAPIQKTADRLAGYLVYFALACAAVTFLLTRDVRSTISVIIVAGACGIAAGTPLAILGAIGRAARSGAIIKGGIHLEILSGIDTVVLDKTGTLTLGTPRITQIDPRPGVSAEMLVQTAAIAERRSEHPLAKAVLEKAAELSLPVVEPHRFEYAPGQGITCWIDGEQIIVGNAALFEARGLGSGDAELQRNGQSQILIARNGRFLGALAVADVLRPEAAQAVAILARMGLRIVLLTGDAPAIAQSIADRLGIVEFHAALLPHQKVEHIRALLAAGRKVAMVGDGINDAPALMEASVGIAMGSGTDVARESADVVLLGNDLLKLVETFAIARWCRRTIMQNFTGTLGVDALGIALAAFGYLNPLLAALIHVGSELAFILNSARLLPSTRQGSGMAAGDGAFTRSSDPTR